MVNLISLGKASFINEVKTISEKAKDINVGDIRNYNSIIDAVYER